MMSKVMEMERFVEQTLLYDFYGELLTEHQRQVYEDVVLNDYSCTEVAKEYDISRQGVHDLIKRCNKILAHYEDQLHLVEKFLSIKEKVAQIHKLAAKLKSKGRVPLLAACDVYRPAAIQQLQINGEKVGVEVFSMGDKQNPVNIAKAAVEHAKSHSMNVVFLDTAGRLHVDEDMMNELVEIKENVDVFQTILTVDSMTGQDAVNVATMFNDKIGIDGVILTKLDGDTRGGAALSIRAVTGKPILYVGMGEKLSDLEQFYPDRMASRILGMGDVLTLIEKAEAQIDADKAKEMEKKIKKAEFDFNDFLESMNQVKNMGGINEIMGMLPGMGINMKNVDAQVDESRIGRIEAIILSMTPEERKRPDILNPSRKTRIAKGAGVDISEVNRLVKQFDQQKKMMKQMSSLMSGKVGKRGKFKLPF